MRERAVRQEVVARRGGHSAQTRVVEVQPTAPLTQNGRTAYLLADQMNRGRHYRSFALVAPPRAAARPSGRQYVTGMTLQGRWVLEDTATGQRFEVTSEQMNTLLQQYPLPGGVRLGGPLSRSAGPGRPLQYPRRAGLTVSRELRYT